MSATQSAANGAPPPPLGDAARVLAQIRAAGLSQAAAAAEIGVSGGALSAWLKGKYKGDSHALARKCDRWIANRVDRAALEASLPPPPQWVETSAARKVVAALGYAQLSRDLAVVHGAAGAGKTTAAKRYAGQRPNVWLVTMSRGTRSLGSCLRRVAQAVGAVPEGRSIADVEDALAERLRGTGGLLAIDEAQCLSLPALDGLRQLHDASGTGLALVGGEALWKRIAGDRASAELAQLFSRVGRRVELAQPSDEDAAALLAAWEGLGESARAAAGPVARQPGGLRALVKVMNWAASMAAGGEVERRHVAAAWKELGGTS
ncbi:MAG: AAA family ATPase [Bryobacterales bacterium]|nr:AAA family ATPase [Bryobacterales bacterium]